MQADGGVAIEVVPGDALQFEADLLVLKHAQGSYGVDEEAKSRLGLDLEIRLRPGEVLTVDQPPGLGVEAVAFLGVPPIDRFGYPEISQFTRRAFALAAEDFPEARHLALTLHGVGFGLDETACFDAELIGLVEAEDLASAVTLERVSIVEYDERRAMRLAGRLEEALPALRQQIFAGTRPKGARLLGARRDGGGRGAPGGAHAFVAMPFAPEFDDLFHYGISAAIHDNGLLVERIDQAAFTGDVLERMKEKIRSATLLVADLSGANPNVYLEVGFAWAAGVPTVLVHDRKSEPKFDVRGQRRLDYGSIKELEDSLKAEIEDLLSA